MFYRYFLGNNRRDWVVSFLFLIAIYLCLIYGLPTDTPYMPHDDDLFIGQASSISLGHWLGKDYGKFTLIKGPYHSVQIWLASVLGAPPMFGLRLFYAGVCALFCSVALSKLPTILKSLALVCLLFDPVLIGASASWRLLRAVSFVPLEVLALTCGICALDCIALLGSENPPLQANKRKILWISVIVSYFCLGLLLITREARIVIVFTALIYSILLLIQAWRYNFLRSKTVLKLLPIALTLFLVFNLPVVSLKVLNRIHYGYAISNEFEEGGFKSFYQDLTSVKLVNADFQPFIPIKKESMNAIVTLAPESQLANTLSNLNQGWTAHGCEINKDWCNEYASGWFMWALRDAIFDSFSIDSPQAFQESVSLLNQELRELCISNTDKLSCKTASFGYLPYPSRWVANDESPLNVFVDTSRDHFSWLISPHPLKRYAAVTHHHEQARAVGVHLTSGYTQDEISRFKQRIEKLTRFGSFLRIILYISFIVVSLTMLIWKPRSMMCLFDPGVIFIATLLVTSFLVLVLVQVTSFPSGAYLSLVAPLTTLFVWRYYDRLLFNLNSKSSANVG
jgi:hypothetical protein